MDTHNNNHLLGEELMAKGFLTAKRLEEALSEQVRTGRKIGTILLDNNYVSEEQIARVLASQQGLPFIDLKHYNVRIETVSILDEMQSRRFRAVVLEDRQSTYLVAVSDPYSLSAQDALSAQLRRPIEIAVVANDQLNDLIERVYNKTDQLATYTRAVESDVDNESNIINLSQISVTVNDVDAPVVKLLQNIFREATKLRASDIHIEPQDKQLIVRYRIDGILHTQVEADIKVMPPLVVKLKLRAALDIAEKRLPQDGRISIRIESKQLDIRMSTMPTQYGESVVLRILVQSQGMKDLKVLGIPAELFDKFSKAISAPSGIVLATGPTGSGKTTTLYGALARLNSSEVKILTCEDPVEYRIGGINQVQVNEKIGLTFPRVLRSFLRQDPDILLVGEIRDDETAEIATRAAMTGHLVLSTLHTNDAISTPTRLMEMGVPGFMIASTLRAVLSQRLVRVVCKDCCQAHELTASESLLVKYYVGEVPSNATPKKGKGCTECNGSGFQGRIGIFELLEMTPELAVALHKEDHIEFESVARKQMGHNSILRHGFDLVFQGVTTVDEVTKNALISD